MSSAKSEATTVANFRCQIRGKLVAKVNAKSEANPEAAEAALKNEIRFKKTHVVPSIRDSTNLL